jgi:hypothetical protein
MVQKSSRAYVPFIVRLVHRITAYKYTLFCVCLYVTSNIKTRLVPRTAKNIPLMYSFLGTALPQSQFPHSCVCERFIYSQYRSTYFLQQNRQINRWNI